MPRSPATAALALSGALTLGCIPSVSVEGRPCPCTEGYQCCDEVCIPEAELCLEAAVDGGGPLDDGGPDSTVDASLTTPDGGPDAGSNGSADGGQEVGDGGACSSHLDCLDPARQACEGDPPMCVDLENWASVDLTYTSNEGADGGTDGGSTFERALRYVYYSDATLSSDQYQSLIRFQQDVDGLTIWSLYVDNASQPGEVTLEPSGQSTYFYFSESSNQAPAEFRGSYFGNSTQSGTITFTEVDLSVGGAVEGSFDVTLHMQGEFRHTIE